jgi:hypothetical protein
MDWVSGVSKRLILFLIFSCSTLYATTFANRPLGEVLKETPIIVRGKTGQSRSEWDKTGRKSLYTYTDFYVTDTIKGNVTNPRITLRQPGGEKDGIEMNVPGTAHFPADEEIVVLLSNKIEADESYDVPGFATGKYQLVVIDGETYLENSMGASEFYDPNKRGANSYQARIEYDIFKKIARGEAAPEIEKNQFKRSEAKTAQADEHAKKSYESTDDAPRTPQAQSVSKDSGVVESERKPLPIWLSLFLSLTLASLVVWFLKKRSSTK